MRVALAAVLVVHGLIHVLGFVKAFGLAALPQLTRPIPPAMGVVWLIAAVLFVLAGAALFVWPRWWWAIGAVAIVVSTIAIVPSWTDARFGALANLILLAGVASGFMTEGPLGQRAAYTREVTERLAATPQTSLLTEADLATLPEPVQRYVRVSGAVGRPKVWNVRARMHGRIRQAPDSPWMPFIVEQYNFFDEPARLFFMDASMWSVPVQVFHRFAGAEAAMRGKAAGLVPIVDASGPAVTQAETVTLFNDMCLLAPATLIDPAVTWEPVDALRARATFSHAGQSIRAELSFNEAGELIDFVSDDRLQAPAGGGPLVPVRWSTPVTAYRTFGPARLAAGGEGRWHEPDRTWTYIEITFDEVEFNVRRR